MRFTVQVILESQSGNDIPYDSLCDDDCSKVCDWIEDRLSEMHEECGSGPKYGFRGLIETIEVNGSFIYFTMHKHSNNHLSDAEMQEEFLAEVSDGYLNDCSNDEIDLSSKEGTRIYFTTIHDYNTLKTDR